MVEGAEVAGAIELDEATNDGGLVVIFSKGNGGFEVLDNLRDGSTVESAFAPHVSSRKPYCPRTRREFIPIMTGRGSPVGLRCA